MIKLIEKQQNRQGIFLQLALTVEAKKRSLVITFQNR